MTDLHLYDKLLQFPLFQGMSQDDLELVATHTKLGFHKVTAGETLVRDGDSSHQLYFLTSGSIHVTTSSASHAFSIIETASAPQMFQIEVIFGLHQFHTRSYTALTECQIITIDKKEITKLFNGLLVFRINFVNLLSKIIQKQQARLWLDSPVTTRSLIVEFVRSHCVYPAGEKELQIKMTQLAHEIHDTRLRVSKALNELQQEHLLKLSRGRIYIPALENL